MKLFAIADVHLGFDSNKPMDIFGQAWDGHSDRLREKWMRNVHPDDYVLMPGDISWAMNLHQARADLTFLDALPGKKIMIRGNHDYWWSTKRKMEAFAAEHGLQTLTFLKNDAYVIDDLVVAGTRGWMLPTDLSFGKEDKRIFERELARLLLSLQAMERKGSDKKRVAMLHYPPLGRDGQATAVTDILEKQKVDICVYGHLHAAGIRSAFEGKKNGVSYRLVSADHLGFCPLCLDG